MADNLKASFYLIKIFSKTAFPLIIASNHINTKLELAIKDFKNIKIEKFVNNNELFQLLKSAQINIVPTFQNTGIKLKLINALFNGRFCLVNNEMILNTGLKKLCYIANSKKEFLQKIEEISQLNFTKDSINERAIVLKKFNNLNNAQKIIDLIN